jgi:Mg/Co/Ni transporter MgtE
MKKIQAIAIQIFKELFVGLIGGLIYLLVVGVVSVFYFIIKIFKRIVFKVEKNYDWMHFEIKK